MFGRPSEYQQQSESYKATYRRRASLRYNARLNQLHFHKVNRRERYFIGDKFGNCVVTDLDGAAEIISKVAQSDIKNISIGGNKNG